MMAYRGNSGLAPRILNLSTRWMCVVSFMSRPLYPLRKILRYQLNMRLLGFQNKSGNFGEEEDILPLPGIETNVMQLCIF